MDDTTSNVHNTCGHGIDRTKTTIASACNKDRWRFQSLTKLGGQKREGYLEHDVGDLYFVSSRSLRGNTNNDRIKACLNTECLVRFANQVFKTLPVLYNTYSVRLEKSKLPLSTTQVPLSLTEGKEVVGIGLEAQPALVTKDPTSMTTTRSDSAPPSFSCWVVLERFIGRAREPSKLNVTDSCSSVEPKGAITDLKKRAI